MQDFQDVIHLWRLTVVNRCISEWNMIHFNEELILNRMFLDHGARGWPTKRRRLPRRIGR